MRERNILITEIQAIQSELESINLRISCTQSISQLIDLGGVIAGWMAFTGEQMSHAKAKWRRDTVDACSEGVILMDADGNAIKNPSVINKYIAARVGDSEADYEFIERVNKSCTHCLDFLRTAISALKEEQKVYSYSQNAI